VTPAGSFLAPDIFLPLERGFPKPNPGETIQVQITREALDDLGEGLVKGFRKRPIASRRIHLVGRDWIYQPLTGHLKARSTATNPNEAEKEALQTLWTSLPHTTTGLLLKGPTQLERLIRDNAPDTIFVDDHEVFMEAKRLCAYYQVPATITRDKSPVDADDIWDSVMNPIVPLAGGGSLVIEETACAITIDVNIPHLDKSRLPTLVEAVADQIRWRQLSGNIIIDFPINNGDSEGRSKILSQLQDHLRDYKPTISQINWSKLGWLEIRTEILRPSIPRRLTHNCEACLGSGRLPL
jgi:Rne/Rng family ribonuclease